MPPSSPAVCSRTGPTPALTERPVAELAGSESPAAWDGQPELGGPSEHLDREHLPGFDQAVRVGWQRTPYRRAARAASAAEGRPGGAVLTSRRSPAHLAPREGRWSDRAGARGRAAAGRSDGQGIAGAALIGFTTVGSPDESSSTSSASVQPHVGQTQDPRGAPWSAAAARDSQCCVRSREPQWLQRRTTIVMSQTSTHRLHPRQRPGRGLAGVQTAHHSELRLHDACHTTARRRPVRRQVRAEKPAGTKAGRRGAGCGARVRPTRRLRASLRPIRFAVRTAAGPRGRSRQ